jgi:hypothetical protein
MNKNIQKASKKPTGRTLYWMSRHWLLIFSVVYGLYVGMPFLAPVFMQTGWSLPDELDQYLPSLGITPIYRFSLDGLESRLV